MQQSLRYIDLFAGCGGLSLGLYKAGLTGLFAIEKNPDAFKTLQHNLIETHKHFEWPEWLPQENWDIKKLLKEKSDSLRQLQGQVDLIVGGPPCQGFSMAGKRQASDSRNKLIHSYLDFVELVKPRAVMFENVHGFTIKFHKSRVNSNQPFSEIVLSRLRELGYSDAQGEMINVSDYGVPQKRHRFFVIATKDGVTKEIFSALEARRHAFLTNRQIVDSNTSQAALSDIEYRHGVVDCPDTKGFKSGLTHAASSNLQRALRLQASDEYVPDSHRFVNHTSEVQEVFLRLLQKAPRNKRIDGEERELYGIKKRSITVLDPHQPAPTITTIPDDFVHYSEPRVMTVRECARLQIEPVSN